MPINITFRTQLLGGVSEFCHDSKLSILRNNLNLVELIVLLAHYQEEGAPLCPKVYITSNIDSLSAMLPGGEKHKIGSSTADAAGIKMALKKCAPLATGDWMLYIQDNHNNIEYGVFKGESNPISVLVDQILLDKELETPVVKVFQIGSECVEISCNNGSKHYIFLNHRKEESPPPLQYFDELINSMTQSCSEKIQDSVSSYLTKLIFEALRQSHGCIIAVTHQEVFPDFLAKDGVVLDQAIDFSALVSEIVVSKADSASIDSKGVLLKGMLNSDGIVVFDTKGRLLGFNCFVKTDVDDKDFVGGARKRAFMTLEKSLGADLTAIFMQSQDGWSDFKGIK